MVSYPVAPQFKVRSLSPGGPAKESSTRWSVSCIILSELKLNPTGKIVKIKLQFSHSFQKKVANYHNHLQLGSKKTGS